MDLSQTSPTSYGEGGDVAGKFAAKFLGSQRHVMSCCCNVIRPLPLSEVCGYQFFESVSDLYMQQTIRIRIRTFLSVTIVFHVPYSKYGHDRSKLNVKRLSLVARLALATGLLYCTTCRLELWDSDSTFL